MIKRKRAAMKLPLKKNQLHTDVGKTAGRVTGSWGCAMQRKKTGQYRNSSHKLLPRRISSFICALRIDQTPLCNAHPQDPVTVFPFGEYAGGFSGLQPKAALRPALPSLRAKNQSKTCSELRGRLIK